MMIYHQIVFEYKKIQKTATTHFVMFYYVLLYLYILAFAVLKYLSFLLWNSSDPKDKFSFYALILLWIIKFFHVVFVL